MTSLCIYVCYFHCVAHEFTSWVHHHLRSGRQHIFRTEGVHYSSGPEFSALGSGSLDVIHKERIGCFLDMLVAVGDGLHEARELVVSVVGLGGNQDFRSGAGNILLLEGALSEEGGLRGEILLG